MPKVIASKQPTIAVVTALYCEKLAVDAMLSDTETYVRFTTVGTFLYLIKGVRYLIAALFSFSRRI
jgi:hypothetical protein